MAPKRHGHIGQGRFRDPPPPSSVSEDGGFGGSARATSRHQLRPRTSQPCRRSPEATDEVPEVTPVRSRCSRDLPDGRRQRADSGVANRDIHPRCKRQAVIDNHDYETSEEDGQVSNESDEDPQSKEVSSSDNGGHDYRQPKHRCF
jgi:hypothetical protein